MGIPQPLEQSIGRPAAFWLPIIVLACILTALSAAAAYVSHDPKDPAHRNPLFVITCLASLGCCTIVPSWIACALGGFQEEALIWTVALHFVVLMGVVPVYIDLWEIVDCARGRLWKKLDLTEGEISRWGTRVLRRREVSKDEETRLIERGLCAVLVKDNLPSWLNSYMCDWSCKLIFRCGRWCGGILSCFLSGDTSGQY